MKPGIFLYRSSIKLFDIAVKVAAFFNPKARLFVEGRKDIFKKLAQELSSSAAEKRVWFHCASLGEFEQGRPVIEKFKTTFPGYEIFLTFYSPSGYEVQKNYKEAKYVFYLPQDSADHARKFFDLVSPHLAFFIKYEFWHYYLNEARERNIPVFSISAIFRPDQLFFKPYGAFYRDMLHCFTHIFVQNQESLKLLKQNGIHQTSVSGDTRFDRVTTLVKNKKEIPIAESFKDNKPLMVIGSSWKEDMAVLTPFINRNVHKLKYIIAPHEISAENIKAIQLSVNLPVILFSEADGTSVKSFQVLIIDNVGMLSSLYAYGDYAYVGGGFGKGLHNILEAATYGIPVIFGNKSYRKFQEAKDLSGLGGAFPVGNGEALNNVFSDLADATFRNKAGAINEQYVLDGQGATDQIIAFCKTIITSN